MISITPWSISWKTSKIFNPMLYKSPLNIYVVWHPDFKDGKKYADFIYKTFNRDTEFALKRNLNIPVFYRSEPDEATKIPIPIPYTEAERNAVVVLIDDELFHSTGWEQYVETEILEKIKDNPNNRVYPIAFSKNAYHLAEKDLSVLQFIQANDVKNDDKAKELIQRWKLIRTRLLHDFARLMYKIDSVGDSEELDKQNELIPNPQVKIFISHTKKDEGNHGEKLAKELRNYINNETQMDSFFDANDIADSYPFGEQMMRPFDKNTAVISVLSDVYATREWCKREIIEAKRKHCPIVVVHHIKKGEIRSFPYLGNVPSLVGAENIEDIIDLTLIQILNARFAEEYLRKHLEMYELENKYQCLKYSKPPELFNHLDIIDEDKKDEHKKNPKDCLVIYPDPPLGDEELKLLSKIMPKIIITTPSHSFQYL
jgi:hypothetical protein